MEFTIFYYKTQELAWNEVHGVKTTEQKAEEIDEQKQILRILTCLKSTDVQRA